MYQAQPTPELIKGLAEKTIRVVACGHNHTLALDDANAAYTWGEFLPPCHCQPILAPLLPYN